MKSMTVVIIKPDGIERGLIGKIISRLENKFLRVVKIALIKKDREWCRQHYQHLVEKSYYEDLEIFMTCAPLLGMIVEGPDCVETVKQMVGRTDSRLADPGTIRGDYGTYPIRYNIVHCAATEKEAEREIELFFEDKS